MSYLLNQEDIFGFALSVGAETHQHGDELWFKRCPKCGGGSHGDRDTFSINLETGAFKCLRASCGYSGHFVEICRDFGYPLDFGEEASKVYRVLPQPKERIQPKPEAIRYLESRGISGETAKRYEITVQKKNPNVLVFPFYDADGVLRFVKYRKTDFRKGVDRNKEWCEADTEPILFGMKQCSGTDRLVITEGQLDSLSVAESGIENAVSVPTGASGFTWLIPCREFLDRFKEIVVFGDCERGHITLIDTLKTRLEGKKILCVRKQDYLGEKDANDILRKYGRNAVRKAVENAEVPRIQHIVDLSSVEEEDLETLDRITTGINDVDKALGGGMYVGQLIVLSGERGEGKSTFASQLCCAALQQKERILVYSGELPNSTFKRILDLQLAGTEAVEKYTDRLGTECYRTAEWARKPISDWYKGRAYIYDNSIVEDDEQTELVRIVEKAVLQYGTRFVLIDNLMIAMECLSDGSDVYFAQSKFVGALKKIAMAYQVVIVLIAHPRKSGKTKDGKKPDFDADTVAGSADVTNKCDILLNYKRSPEGADYNGMVQICKNRLTGELYMYDNGIKLNYSKSTRRVFSVTDRVQMRYGWNHGETEKHGYYKDDGQQILPF